MNCLYILDSNTLLVSSFEVIFSHSIDCLFVLLMVSFAVQKLLSAIWSHLFIFTFILLPKDTEPRKCCYILCQRMLCLSCFLGVL